MRNTYRVRVDVEVGVGRRLAHAWGRRSAIAASEGNARSFSVELGVVVGGLAIEQRGTRAPKPRTGVERKRRVRNDEVSGGPWRTVPVCAFARSGFVATYAPMAQSETTSIRLAGPADGALLGNLLEFYIYELSDVFPHVRLGADCKFGYPSLPLYFAEGEQRFPFLISQGHGTAGFVLVTRGLAPFAAADVYDIAEFFVLRRERRAGAGRAAARELWRRLPGLWQVRVAEAHVAALAFWSDVIDEFTGGTARRSLRSEGTRRWHVFEFEVGVAQGEARAPRQTRAHHQRPDAAGRLEQQWRFLREIDRLKSIERQSILADASRRENSAEHSWHLSVLAVCLVEHAAHPEVDLFKVVKMLLLHDIVEIDAGDAFLHDAEALAAQAAKEQAAAERIFGLLPADQRDELLALWHEFEAQSSAESLLAHAFDRVQPALLHDATGGVIWQKYGTTHAQIQEKMRIVQRASPALWARVQEVIARARAAGRFGA
jgi:putative hydrolases of HD superfamily